MLRKHLHKMKNASKTDQENKRETFIGLAEENERLNSDLYKVGVINICFPRLRIQEERT